MAVVDLSAFHASSLHAERFFFFIQYGQTIISDDGPVWVYECLPHRQFGSGLPRFHGLIHVHDS